MSIPFVIYILLRSPYHHSVNKQIFLYFSDREAEEIKERKTKTNTQRFASPEFIHPRSSHPNCVFVCLSIFYPASLLLRPFHADSSVYSLFRASEFRNDVC